MKKLVAALAVIVILTGCVYDPVNYDKIHDQEFQDHLRQKRLVIKNHSMSGFHCLKSPTI